MFYYVLVFLGAFVLPVFLSFCVLFVLVVLVLSICLVLVPAVVVIVPLFVWIIIFRRGTKINHRTSSPLN